MKLACHKVRAHDNQNSSTEANTTRTTFTFSNTKAVQSV